MSKEVRHVINGISAVLLSACLILAYMSGVSCRAPLECTGLDVVIADSSMNNFVSKADVKAFLDMEYGTYIGQPLDSIDLVQVEKIIDGRSAVHKSQAYITRDGRLNIRVTQRRPMVRFQKKDGGFYADADGFLFPLQSSYASRVQVVDGDIPLKANSGYKGEITDPKEKEWIEKVLRMVRYMEESKTWKDKIVQMTVSDNGELTLVPREGKERFLFGQPDNIEDKFSRMEMYYTGILPAKGEGKYTKISVEYDGQIVCR